ncbi:MAG: AAA family ATPase [Hydrogenophaga sp.]|nr:AAA family ATPase [Hydrogenophaga sp.]
MRVLTINLEGPGLPRSIPFAVKPSANETGNWITVLSGENGTRKSVLLRLITSAALNGTSYRTSSKWLSTATLNSSDPVRYVLAASGTYSDRFPQVVGAQITRPLSGFDLDNFSYFGPRYAGNVAGRGRMAAGLLLSMLENPIAGAERAKSVSAVLQCLGFTTEVRAVLAPRRGVDDVTKGAKGLRLYADKVLSNLRSSEASFAEEMRQFLNSLDVDSAIKEVLYTQDLVISLDEKGAVEIKKHKWLVPYLKAGMLNVADLKFFSTKGKQPAAADGVSVDDLSSGQLQILNNLLNLSLCVKDDSLVLIDEPENSLHPEWQRDYISLLRRSLACAKKCHIVIATHSPLVASGVQSSEGSLIGLRRNEDDGSIEVVPSEAVHGWLPSTVLEERFDMETVRAPELSKAVATALDLLKTKGGDKARLRQACAVLKELLKELPPDDVIVPAIEAIIELGEA